MTTMTLAEFIKQKMLELMDKYRYVELAGTEAVMLFKNGVTRTYDSSDTPHSQLGREVSLHELVDGGGVNYVSNGTLVEFDIKLPRKRKTTNVKYYFLWEDSE